MGARRFKQEHNHRVVISRPDGTMVGSARAVKTKLGITTYDRQAPIAVGDIVDVHPPTPPATRYTAISVEPFEGHKNVPAHYVVGLADPRPIPDEVEKPGTGGGDDNQKPAGGGGSS